MDNTGTQVQEWVGVSMADLPRVASEIFDLAGTETVWLLEGPMGAGKTTFAKALCAQLGVVDTVNSPTFSLVNEYQTDAGDPVYHFDFYRMERPQEALEIGVEEYFDSGALCLLEWAEKIAPYLPASYLSVSITPTSATARTLVCQRYE